MRRPPAPARPGGRILCYHGIGTPGWGYNDVSPQRFRRHLELALAHGYRFVPAGQIAAGRSDPFDLAVTFDDGLASTVDNGAPILRDLGLPWTLFVVTDWAAGRHTWPRGTFCGWDQLRALADEPGVGLGSHSESHPDFGTIGIVQAARELRHSRQILEHELNRPIETFAIPFGQSTNWAAGCGRLATAAGYHTVYAQAEATRPAGTVARTFVTGIDDDRILLAALRGAFDSWEE